MDLVTLAIISGTLVMAAICWYLFNNIHRETSFEETYGKSVKKLLGQEDKTNNKKPKPATKKAKPKNVEKNKTGETAASTSDLSPSTSKKQLVEEAPTKETNVNGSSTSSSSEKVSNQQQSAAPAPPPSKVAQKESKPKNEPKVKNPPKKVEEVFQTGEPLARSSDEEWKENTSGKKNKKKNRSRAEEIVERKPEIEHMKSESVIEAKPLHQQQQPEVNEVKLYSTPLASVDVNRSSNSSNTTTSNAKSRGKRAVSKDLSLGEVVERLQFINDLEPEYVEYLSRFSEHSNNKESKLNEIINSLQNQIVELKKKSKVESANLEKEQKLQNEIRTLKSQLAEQLDKNNTYESSFGPKLAQVLEENQQLKAHLAQSKQDSQNYHREIEFLRKELQKQPKIPTDDYEKQQQIIQSLTLEKAELQNAFRETIAKQNESGKYEAEYNRIQEQFNQLSQNFKNSEAQKQGIKKEYENLLKVYSELNKAHISTNSEIKELSEQSEHWKNGFNDLKSKFDSKLAELEQAKTKLQQLEQDVQVVQEIKAKAQEDQSHLVDLEKENQDLNQKNSILAKKLEDFENWFKNVQQENEKSKKVLEQTQKSQQENESKLEDEKARSSKLESEKEKLSDEISQLKKQLEEKTKKNLEENQKVQAENENKYQSEQARARELELENQKLGEEVSTLQNKLVELEESFNKSKEGYENSLLDLERSKQILDEKELKREEEMAQFEALENTNNELNEQLSLSQSKVADLEASIKQFHQENENHKKFLARNQELEAEILNLTKQLENIAQNANKNKSQDDFLIKELEDQKQRNQELRQINYKLLEDYQKQEASYKKILTQQQAPSATTTKPDEGVLVKQQSVVVSAPSIAPVEIVHVQENQELAKTKALNKKYEQILNKLRVDILNVEKIAHAHAQEKDVRIAELEAKLKSIGY